MATAMFESKDVPANFTAFCPGYAQFYGRTFHCWRPAGHGIVNLHTAIVQSCDVFFYTLGQRIGIDEIHKYGAALGLARSPGLDLPGEHPGLVPS
jgi:penicillin-binding protein 2